MQLSWSVIVLSQDPGSNVSDMLQKECGFFMWIDQTISHGIKERLSYSPQPRVTRLHPYGEIKEIFKKHRQEAKQKAFIQHQRHTLKYAKAF